MAVVPCPEREVVVAPSQALVSLETPEKKRGPSKENSLEPPLKKGKGVKEGEPDEGREWERSVEPPFCLNFTGKFAGKGSRFVVSVTEMERRMTLTSEQSSNLFNPVRGDLGLILAGGLATRALEETVERTSTTDLFAQMTNRVETVRTPSNLLLTRFFVGADLASFIGTFPFALGIEQGSEGGGADDRSDRSAAPSGGGD
ncbi:hypothetical protein AXF42_Ash000498 [Apostasia shenzhenica]|uniref:Uncharacterized protein n=1 Tax=Apostasia shenzhenica TaxID=1088818 RepID=A0A2I0AGI6_9ASPA|nr:hypothetical protein AXF42_Ash000498 [Apostasia shenzhenica]